MELLQELSLGEFYFLRTFRSLIAQSTANEKLTPSVCSFLKSCDDPYRLIRLTQFELSLESWLRNQQMQDYWDDAWKKLGMYPTFYQAQNDETLVYQELKPQAKISSFDLVRGRFYYDIANLLVDKGIEKTNATVKNLLTKSADYHCFLALQALANMVMMEDNQDDLQQLLLKRLLPSARIHGTPVYLLCATVCINLAEYHLDNDSKLNAQCAYQQALQYLQAAKGCQEASATEIHNAYFGCDIAASNSWGIDDITKMCDEIIILANLTTDKTAQQLARQAGEKLAKEFSMQTQAEEVSHVYTTDVCCTR